jgi:hypothetical protein
LKDRVLYKDGDWNTICLPFSLDKTQLANSPLAGCTLMEMNEVKTAFNQTTGELTLWFDEVNLTPDDDQAGDPVAVIKAGTPYLIRWAKPDGYVAYDGTNATECSDIIDPVFANVTFDNSASTETTSSDHNVTFQGTYNPVYLYDDPHSRYYLGTNNTLFYPKNSFVLFNAFRAYFELELGDETLARELTPVFNFHFGDDATGISVSNASTDENMVWYSLDGLKLDKKPTTKGLYIVNGKKMVIK